MLMLTTYWLRLTGASTNCTYDWIIMQRWETRISCEDLSWSHVLTAVEQKTSYIHADKQHCLQARAEFVSLAWGKTVYFLPSGQIYVLPIRTLPITIMQMRWGGLIDEQWNLDYQVGTNHTLAKKTPRVWPKCCKRHLANYGDSRHWICSTQ